MQSKLFFLLLLINTLNLPSYRNFFIFFFRVIHSTITLKSSFFCSVPDRQLNKMPAAIIAVLTFYMYPSHSTNTRTLLVALIRHVADDVTLTNSFSVFGFTYAMNNYIKLYELQTKFFFFLISQKKYHQIIAIIK